MKNHLINEELQKKRFNPEKHGWKVADEKPNKIIYTKDNFKLIQDTVIGLWIILYDTVYNYIPIFIGEIESNYDYEIICNYITYDTNKIHYIINSINENQIIRKRK